MIICVHVAVLVRGGGGGAYFVNCGMFSHYRLQYLVPVQLALSSFGHGTAAVVPHYTNTPSVHPDYLAGERA